ncbi:MAG TPA: cyclic nucleotide-binding domain-containing protein [Actinomycetota bacterium]|nr:cyclic nucleotide-binding domain-containing protein [Actinomycetota bacterium]
MSGQRRAARWPSSIAAGLIVGAVEALLAISFAALVFAGYLESFLGDGIGLYLGGAAVTLGGFAWLAGPRGVVGGMQAAGAAVVAIVVAGAAIDSTGGPEPSFLTAVAATLVVTVLCGIVLLVLGIRQLANLIRFVPYPVVGGLLAGIGWLLLKGGVYVASAASPYVTPLSDLLERDALERWLPAVALGVILLLAVRIVKRPLVIPIVIAAGFLAFAIGMLMTGSTIESARDQSWLLGPLDGTLLWRTWTMRGLAEADWLGVLGQWAAIAAAVFVTGVAILFDVTRTEAVLDRDLDTNRELRHAGVVDIVAGAIGGIPGSHALSSTTLAGRMRVDARVTGLIAAAVAAVAAFAGGTVVGLIPRMIAGGVLAFLGLASIVEWVWDRRRVLPPLEYGVVLLILVAIVVRGFLPGVVLGLVLAVVLFAISYGRIDLVREVAFGDTYHSNVDRPPAERARLRALADRIQILRVSGFLFFGSTSGLLERVREGVQRSSLSFVVIDLRRVTGVDSSAVATLAKMLRLAQTHGFQVVLTGASGPVRAGLERGGVRETEGIVRFAPDLDRGLQWCEDALLGTAAETAVETDLDGQGGLPPGVVPYLERISVPAGAVLIRQDEPPGDVYVLASGRLAVQTLTAEGTRIRLGTLRPGVVVGEVGLYTGVPRTADVVAETPSDVLRFSAGSIARMEAEEPAVAAALHRWLATTLADRLHETQRTFETLLE